jgi:hypothetical protein
LELPEAVSMFGYFDIILRDADADDGANARPMDLD